MPATPKGKEKVPSRNTIIEILLFKLVELIVVFLNLVWVLNQTEKQEEVVLLKLCVVKTVW